MTYHVLIAVSMKVTAVTFRKHLFRPYHPKRMQKILQISDKLVPNFTGCQIADYEFRLMFIHFLLSQVTYDSYFAICSQSQTNFSLLELLTCSFLSQHSCDLIKLCSTRITRSPTAHRVLSRITRCPQTHFISTTLKSNVST